MTRLLAACADIARAARERAATAMDEEARRRGMVLVKEAHKLAPQQRGGLASSLPPGVTSVTRGDVTVQYKPGGVVELPRSLTDEELQQIKRVWVAKGGPPLARVAGGLIDEGTGEILARWPDEPERLVPLGSAPPRRSTHTSPAVNIVRADQPPPRPAPPRPSSPGNTEGSGPRWRDPLLETTDDTPLGVTRLRAGHRLRRAVYPRWLWDRYQARLWRRYRAWKRHRGVDLRPRFASLSESAPARPNPSAPTWR